MVCVGSLRWYDVPMSEAKIVRTVQTFRETKVEISKNTSNDWSEIGALSKRVHETFDNLTGMIIDSCLEAGNPRCNLKASHRITGVNEFEGDFECTMPNDIDGQPRPCSLAGDTDFPTKAWIADEIDLIE